MAKKSIPISKRQLMFAENVKRSIAEIFIKDGFLSMYGLPHVTITRAIATPDLKLVKIYIDASLINQEIQDLLVSSIQSHEKKLKPLLAKKIFLRLIPNLMFILDEGGFYIPQLSTSEE